LLNLGAEISGLPIKKAVKKKIKLSFKL